MVKREKGKEFEQEEEGRKLDVTTGKPPVCLKAIWAIKQQTR